MWYFCRNSKHGMELNLPLLKLVSETPGVPGFEKKIRDVIINEVKDVAESFSVDNMGNLLTVIKGQDSSKRIMVAAHMDEIGYMVSHIDDDGFVYFNTLGGFDPKTLTAQRVVIHGKEDLVGVMSSKPIHMMTADERTKMPKTTDFYIDLGLPGDKVKELVEVGNPITRHQELMVMGNCVNGKSLDNRVSVYVLIETLKDLKKNPPAYDFYGVFTVQEEVGLRGANVAAHNVNPDFGIALDTTIAFDLPGAKAQEKVSHLGKGTGIKIMDAMAICDYRMIDFMKQTANDADIPYQPEIMVAGGTDTAGVQRMGKSGAIAGAVSIPTRHLHQVVEMCHPDDINWSIQLLSLCAQKMADFDWNP